ncbi:hypothetical protein [Limosilactobacillus fermentum]|uniref:hypothetical protein n=1 Tax=Limosilactobacillus fermentum TaxID=1613 RepID=UPI003EBB4588
MSRAEQSRAEQSRAEQSRAEQSRAERLSYLIGHSLVGMSARAVIAMADLRGLEKGLWVNGGGPLYGQLYFNPLSITSQLRRTHVTTRTIRDRYEKGLRGKELLVSHVKTRKGKLITFKGEELTAGELAERYPKLSANQIQARYRRGKRDDQLVAPIRSNKSRPELLSG